MIRAMHPRKLLEPLDVWHQRVMKAVASRWGNNPKSKKQEWIDKAALERNVATVRADPLASYVKAMSEAKDVETTGTPWGLPDCEFPVAEAVLRKAMTSCQTTGKRKYFLRTYSEAWHKEHGCFIEKCCNIPDNLRVTTPCGEIASTCLNSHKDEVVKLKTDIVTLLKGWVAPNGVVTRGRCTMLQLWSDNNGGLPGMLASLCLFDVLFALFFDENSNLDM